MRTDRFLVVDVEAHRAVVAEKVMLTACLEKKRYEQFLCPSASEFLLRMQVTNAFSFY